MTVRRDRNAAVCVQTHIMPLLRSLAEYVVRKAINMALLTELFAAATNAVGRSIQFSAGSAVGRAASRGRLAVRSFWPLLRFGGSVEMRSLQGLATNSSLGLPE